MPILQIRLHNISLENADSVIKGLSSSVASIVGKPESYVMVSLLDGLKGCFGGTTDPYAYVTLENIGNIPSEKKEQLANAVSSALGLSASRQFMRFMNFERSDLVFNM
eukprot:CAMPEP_0177655346 /NCGR_PEP_ID=MMETSP0447-20121125/14908_1 /TAXON_ID=0 /ORGANISM="Stygamoeba regulata, Strain BSH-02190019" /LENGTH=107 /DNA_ID=CAMNT_0019159239 /DNA_START=23 /DNA_END=346 /DNA_ORIENTATION=-